MFRIYRTPVEWIDRDTAKLKRSEATINLFDVARWEVCSEKHLCNYDGKERTTIYFKNGQFEYLPISIKKFDGIMLDFLRDAGILDDRTLDAPKPIKFAHTHYKGPVRWIFREAHGAIGVTAFPKYAKLSTPEDYYIQNLYGGITSLS